MTDFAIYDMDRTVTRRATYTPFLLHCALRRAPWRLLLLPFAVGFRTSSRGLVWTLWTVALLVAAYAAASRVAFTFIAESSRWSAGRSSNVSTICCSNSSDCFRTAIAQRPAAPTRRPWTAPCG